MDETHGMVLAIDGRLEGSAADGLRVVNNSPITDIVGSVFSEWEAAGQLQTDLQLQLILGDATQPPDINVKTAWRGVDLQVHPGNLLISSINGEFSYNSELGLARKT